MIRIDSEMWNNLRDGVKNYINLYYKDYIDRGIKPILIGLFGKKTDPDYLPPKSVREWIEKEWIRGSRRGKVAEFLILWRYLKIKKVSVILEDGPCWYRLEPFIETKELKSFVL